MENLWLSDRIEERIYLMFNESTLTDVKLIVGHEKKIIKAHKLILAAGSQEFYSRLYFSPNKTTTNELELLDENYDIISVILRYLYSDTPPDRLIALQVLTTANKYGIISLSNICRKLIQQNITVDNVLEIYQSAIVSQETDLIDICWYVICENTTEVVQSPSFRTIDIDLMIKIVETSNLNINEYTLYEEIMSWASEKCRKQNIKTNPSTLRTCIEPFLHLIRFPVMTTHELFVGPIKSQILTPEEVNDLDKWNNSANTTRFLTTERDFKLISLSLDQLYDNLRKQSVLAIRFNSDCKVILVAIDYIIRDESYRESMWIQLVNEETGQSERVTLAKAKMETVNQSVVILNQKITLKLTFPQIIQPDCDYIIRPVLSENELQVPEFFPSFKSVKILNVNLCVSVIVHNEGTSSPKEEEDEDDDEDELLKFQAKTYQNQIGKDFNVLTSGFHLLSQGPCIQLSGLSFHKIT